MTFSNILSHFSYWMDGWIYIMYLTHLCYWGKGQQGDMWRQVVRTPLHPLVYLPLVPCIPLTLPHQCRVARWDASEEFKEREGQTREPKSLPHHSLTRALSTVTAAMESRLVGKTLERVIHCTDLDIGQHSVVLQILTMWLLLRQGNLPLGNILQCFGC